MRRFLQRLLLPAVVGAALGQAAEPPAPPPPSGEPLAVIVHKTNPVENLTFAELRKLCLAERQHWDHGRKVTIVLRETEQAERRVVLEKIYGMKENDFNRFFLQSTFTGAVQSAPKQLATAAGVRRFVFNVPGAIGFVRASDVDDTVKVVRLDGRTPSDPGYPLSVAGPDGKPGKPEP